MSEHSNETATNSASRTPTAPTIPAAHVGSRRQPLLVCRRRSLRLRHDASCCSSARSLRFWSRSPWPACRLASRSFTSSAFGEASLQPTTSIASILALMAAGFAPNPRPHPHPETTMWPLDSISEQPQRLLPTRPVDLQRAASRRIRVEGLHLPAARFQQLRRSPELNAFQDQLSILLASLTTSTAASPVVLRLGLSARACSAITRRPSAPRTSGHGDPATSASPATGAR